MYSTFKKTSFYGFCQRKQFDHPGNSGFSKKKSTWFLNDCSASTPQKYTYTQILKKINLDCEDIAILKTCNIFFFNFQTFVFIGTCITLHIVIFMKLLYLQRVALLS